MTVLFTQDAPFEERLSSAQLEHLVLQSMTEAKVRFLHQFLQEVQVLLSAAEFTDDAKRRWPLLARPADLYQAFSACLVSDDEGIRMEVASAARLGLTQELLVALEYGDPVGVPPIGMWGRASRLADRVSEEGLGEVAHRAFQCLSRPGRLRHRRLD